MCKFGLGGRLSLAGLAWLPLTASASPIEIDPPDTEVVLEECATVEETLTVIVPPDGQVQAVDVYLLADTSGSMEPVISAVQADVIALVEELQATFPGVDLRFGVGAYRDFPITDEYAFDHVLSPSADASTVAAAVNDWTVQGGGDAPEGQLYALDQVARDLDPAGGAIGWRPDAERIVVWFGDAPGHDPICDAMTGLGYDIDEGSVTAELQAAGIQVIALSTVTAYADGLDADPTAHTWAYADICAIGGSAGQATRIADATGGIHEVGVQDEAVVDTIAALVEDEVRAIDTLEVVPSASIARFVDDLSEPYGPVDVRAGAEIPFDVRWYGDAPCEREDRVFDGTLDVLADGAEVAAQDVRIVVPACTWHVEAMLLPGRGVRSLRAIAVLGESGFDVDWIDPDTVQVDGRAIRGFHLEDVDGDGDLDAVVLALRGGPGAPVVTGWFWEGYRFEAEATLLPRATPERAPRRR